MDDVIKELKTIKQRLSNLECKVKEGEEKRENLAKSFKSSSETFEKKKFECQNNQNSHFEDDSFTTSSLNVERKDNKVRDDALNNFSETKVAGK